MLKRLNLMTREDVSLLAARLETLTQKINEYAVRHEAAVEDHPETTHLKNTVPAAKASRTKKG